MPFSYPLIAAVITLLFPQLCVRLWQVFRQHEFRVYEIAPPDAPHAVKSLGASSLDTASDLLREDHEGAITAQNRYQDSVARAAAGLLLAFIALAISLTLPVDKGTKATLAWIDLFALSVAAFGFASGKARLRTWIHTRTTAELLRHAIFLRLFFTFPGSASHGGITHWYQSQRTRIIKEVIVGNSIGSLPNKIETFWLALKHQALDQETGESGINPQLVNQYRQRRAIRQLRWFSDSEARLIRREHRRGSVLFVMYISTVVLAASKVALVLLTGPSAVVAATSLLLLLLTALSAAITAVYLSQNGRSLIHRYASQRRSIQAWLDAFDREVQCLPQPTEDSRRLLAAIIQFEEMMVAELVDWVSITERDSIEVAP